MKSWIDEQTQIGFDDGFHNRVNRKLSPEYVSGWIQGVRLRMDLILTGEAEAPNV